MVGDGGMGEWGDGEMGGSPITDYRLPITDYRLPITHYPSPITHHPLPN
ncbi:hypothetical protein PJF56_03770 [Roseofilum sp. BLCC_M91]|uniref:Uncharacterized protein n=1 Tax=Roseofilum halophilum BLCC-M91 TaxID=3022259 RepID=A0ABT7BFM8_9CYAN|nr:hypothetical protein [Roseofilum halophilum]MDJ1177977.1 hypothetical protein [Roseofilum halophilum BLCC-M91]